MSEYFTVEYPDGVILKYQTTRPVGVILDPTDALFTPEGKPGWPVCRREADLVFCFDYQTVATLQAAIEDPTILNWHTSEIRDLEVITKLVGLAISLYLRRDAYRLVEESHQHAQCFFELARWLGDQELCQAMRRLGGEACTYNPHAMAHYFFDAIYRLEKKRPNVRFVVVEVLGRKAVFEFTRALNHRVLQEIINELYAVMGDTLFQIEQDGHAAREWYNEVATNFERAAVVTKQLWGAPYAQLGLGIRNEIKSAIDQLKQSSHSNALNIILTLIADLQACPQVLTTLRASAVALKSSADPTNHLPDLMRGLEELGKQINALASTFHEIARMLWQTKTEIELSFTKGEYLNALQQLDYFISQCAW